MLKNKLTTLLLLSLASTTLPHYAEEKTDNEDEENLIVVTSRVPVPIREVATSVSVITEEQLLDRGFANLAEALKVQPAVYVDSNGSIGSPTSLRIRGEEAYRTLVRIDGVDISDPTLTQVSPQLGQLMSSNIDRVEILRGPQGLVYGADAGGVINITSGYADPGFQGQVSVEAGRFSTESVTADVGYGGETFDFYLSASDYNTDGINSQVSDTTEDADGYDNTTLHARLGVMLHEQLKLTLVARDTEGESEYDSCFRADFSSTNDCLSLIDQQNVRASLDLGLASGNHQIAFVQTDITRDFLTEGVSSFLSEGEIERFEYLGNTQISETTNLIYGVDRVEESITTDGQSRQQTGYYVEYQSELSPNLFVTAGLRQDDTDDVGDHTSYRLSAAYIVPTNSGEVKYRASYGTGFRAPSLFEVNYNAGPFAFPPASDTQLTEETSQGFEIGIEFAGNDGDNYQLVFFDQEVEDAIFFDLASFSGYLQDEGTSFSKGIELVWNLQLSESFTLDANYTYNDTEDTAGDRRLRRPRDLLNVGLFYQQENLTVSGYVRMVDGVVDGGMELDGYEVLDLSVRYQATSHLEIFARVENAFDRDYQDIATFNTAGASAYAGFRLQF